MSIFRRNRKQEKAPEKHSPPGRLPWEARSGDVGIRIIDAIGHSFSLDEDWCVRDERGFTWWGKDLAQRVWAEAGRDDDGFDIFRLHARTDLFSGFDPTAENLAKLNALAGFATTSGFLVDEKARTVQFAATMYAHAETEDWVRRTFQLVVAMQAADAQIKADNLAEPLGLTVATSPHPVSGVRLEYDDMLSMLEQVEMLGRRPTTWAGEDLEWTTSMVQQLGMTVLATGDGSGLTVEFPFQSRTSLVRVITEAPNPQLGNGALLLLQTPMAVQQAEGIRFAAELTRRELDSPMRSHQAHCLGSWCWREDGMHFVSFLPNMLNFDRGALFNIVMSMGARAKWVAETFYGDDWNKNRDEYGLPLARPALLDLVATDEASYE